AGGGMRVKILDAWSWGLPIVSTTIGAEGLRAADGENLLIADSAADFAEALKRVLTDRTLA
ncbi:MAG: glycosyltransferase, partial [Acidobacteria bacterium]|nr:glycosyltransferase [Acidobacteriota bacterium]NIQ83998.1 glycosyltransferase [Acidobacteriota bacterium]